MMTSRPRTYLRSLVRVRLNHTQAQPVFKREGPAALKSDPHRFDNGSNSPQFPMEAQKRRTMKEAFPNAPTATRRAEPEPESPAGQSGSFSDHRGGGPRVAGEQRTHTEEAAHTSTIVHAAKKVKNAFTGKRAYSTKPTYTTADAPISSREPRPAAPEGAVPSGQTTNASTKAGAPHKDVHTMARGAQETGSDAIKPEDRSQKVWGPNTRSAQFNDEEGNRNPLRDGGSHEGGFDKHGNSTT